MPEVVLDLSNLRHGGALQAASALLADLSMVRPLPEWLHHCEVRVSSQVLDHLTVPQDSIPGVLVARALSKSQIVAFPSRHDRRPTLRFRLFGPSYDMREARVEVMGFASGRLLFPEQLASGSYRVESVRWKAEKRFKLWAARHADYYVVETSSVARKLQTALSLDPARIHVVHNEPHAVFRLPKVSVCRWTPGDPLVLIYPARAYRHKNHEIIPEVIRRSAAAHGIRANVHVTLRTEEWHTLKALQINGVTNLGELDPRGLAHAYSRAHAVFFPSLLEASSATPLEARVQGLPLLGSDRSFVRESAGSASVFFEPTDVDSAVSALATFSHTYPDLYALGAADSATYRYELESYSRTRSLLRLIGSLLDSQ